MDIENLTNDQKYEFLVKQAAKQKEIWLLQATDGMYAMFEGTGDQQYIPVWPDRVDAQKQAEGDWDQYTPARMNIREFIGWMDELKEDKILIALFPDEKLQVIPIDPLELKAHLEYECNQL